MKNSLGQGVSAEGLLGAKLLPSTMLRSEGSQVLAPTEFQQLFSECHRQRKAFERAWEGLGKKFKEAR